MKDMKICIEQQIDNILLELLQQMDGKLININNQEQFRGVLMKVLKRRNFPDQLADQYVNSIGCRNN